MPSSSNIVRSHHAWIIKGATHLPGPGPLLGVHDSCLKAVIKLKKNGHKETTALFVATMSSPCYGKSSYDTIYNPKHIFNTGKSSLG